MAFEVEQKFRIADLPAFERRLAELDSEHRETVEQVDWYFAHPSRDFAGTDEALRLRQVGQHNELTYKGPKIDSTTKTRQEIEIALAAGQQSATDAAALLEALGFTSVAQVRKRRIHSTLRWQNREVGIAIDHVAELGDFVELEIIATQEGVGRARDCIASLASRLDLGNSERRSYLELLLLAQQPSGGTRE